MTIPASTEVHWDHVDEVGRDLGPTVVAIGVFDGLHRGHAHLLAEARRLADARRLPLVLVTFDPHPATIAGPTRDTTAIVSVNQRVQLAHQHGADRVLVLRFDEDLAAVTAEDFVHTVLVESLHAVNVVVGSNFHFGRGGRGDLALLRRLGNRHGFTAHGITLLPGCSSTRIRAMVARGDVADAGVVLGRPFSIEGLVLDGLVTTDPDLILPPPGRYHARIDGRATVLTIRDDHSVRVRDQLNGPVAISVIGAA